jgi:2-polyprenyl-3-methyl-5-hydroxy-6-metoxy-1,4-benzoquinol methylase
VTIQRFVSSFCRGKRVLDVGCVDHTASAASADTWLHRYVALAASSVLGVDLAAAEVLKLRDRGYNVITADAQVMSLGERFETIVVGELIEHVESPGALLRNLRDHLEPGGQILITTPNPWYAYHWVESLLFDPRQRWNPEHVAWFDAFTLGNLVKRCGFRVESVMHFARSRKVQQAFTRPPKWMCSTVAIVARTDA